MHTSRKLPVVCRWSVLPEGIHRNRRNMKSTIIKISNSIDEKWNRIISVIGGPFIMFVFMKYVENSSGYESIRCSIFFGLAVLFASATIFEGLIAWGIGWILFKHCVQPLFFKGIAGFFWWNCQSACAAAITLFVVNIVINLIVILRTGE